MTFTEAGADKPAGVPDFDTVEIKQQYLRLIANGRPRLLDRESVEAEPWWSRKFVATREINDDDAVETLAPVRNSMRREQTYRQCLALADSLAASAITVFTAAIWGASLTWLFVLVPAVAVLIAKVEGLYDRDDMVIRKSTLGEWRIVARAAALTTMGTYLIWWISTAPPEGRGIRVFAVLFVGMFLLQVPARGVARRLARVLATDERCLIVGSADRCAELAHRLGEIPGVDLIGTVPDDDVDCSVAGVHELVQQLDVERIILVPHPAWGERGGLKLIQSSKWLGIRISFMPTLMTVVGAAATIDELDSMVLLGVPRFGLSRSSQALKRALDLACATTILLLSAPVFLLATAAVKLDSPGPALFRQKRIGRGGSPFTMYKFRSMVDDAELMKTELNAHNETSGLFKMTHDPRITRVGRFLRRTYLDELPQLINVLRGEMSLVGPRPLIESEDSLLTGYDRHRSRLTPGITGPWQLRGPLDASLPELAKLDYMYASDWSIWADIDILLGTVARVLSRQGH